MKAFRPEDWNPAHDLAGYRHHLHSEWTMSFGHWHELTKKIPERRMARCREKQARRMNSLAADTHRQEFVRRVVEAAGLTGEGPMLWSELAELVEAKLKGMSLKDQYLAGYNVL